MFTQWKVFDLTTIGRMRKKKKNGCGPIAGNRWLNYVTPSLLGLCRYPIGPLIARTPNWLGANGSHHLTWENPNGKHTRQTHLNIETVQMDKFCDQGQSWSRPEIILPFKQGRPVWQPVGIMVVIVGLRETEWTPKAQCSIYSSNVSKPQKHPTSPLPACCREQNDTNRKYCSAAGRVAENNSLRVENLYYCLAPIWRRIWIRLHPPSGGSSNYSILLQIYVRQWYILHISFNQDYLKLSHLASLVVRILLWAD